jgi:hypothetical protein
VCVVTLRLLTPVLTVVKVIKYALTCLDDLHVSDLFQCGTKPTMYRDAFEGRVDVML